jgi:hypothetical protein
LAKALLAAASTVQMKFAADNPGYSLGISPLGTRERQVNLWAQTKCPLRCVALPAASLLEARLVRRAVRRRPCQSKSLGRGNMVRECRLGAI